MHVDPRILGLVRRYAVDEEDVSDEVEELCGGNEKCLDLVWLHLDDAFLIYDFFVRQGDLEAAENNLLREAKYIEVIIRCYGPGGDPSICDPYI